MFCWVTLRNEGLGCKDIHPKNGDSNNKWDASSTVLIIGFGETKIKALSKT